MVRKIKGFPGSLWGSCVVWELRGADGEPTVSYWDTQHCVFVIAVTPAEGLLLIFTET